MTEEHCECDTYLETSFEGMLDQGTIGKISDFFKIFGDPTRIRILWTLHGHELCVNALGRYLGMTDSAISHQLRVLSEAGLVKSRREGKNVYYSLCDDHIEIVLKTALEHVTEGAE